MILGITGDWHIHNFPEFGHPWREGLNTRARDIYHTCAEILPKALKHYKVDVVVHLGDFNFNASNDYRLENLTKDAVGKCLFYAVQTVACSGNHDTVSANPNNHNGYLYLPSGSFDVRPYGSISGGVSCYFWPISYTTPLPEEKDLEALSDCLVFFFLHKDLQGAKTSQGFVYKSQQEVPLSKILNIKKVVPQAKFFAGHLHQRQMVGRVVEVVGAPVQHNRGDEGQKRGFVVYDTTSEVSKFIALPGPRFFSGDLKSVQAKVAADKGDKETVYLTIYVSGDNLSKKRLAQEFVADSGYNGVVKDEKEKEVLEDQEVSVVSSNVLSQSDEELLEQWLRANEPNLAPKEVQDLIEVSRTL